MFVRTRLESLLGLCLLVCTCGHASAQSSNPKTLGDMIEQAKRQQAQALNPAAKVAVTPAKKSAPTEGDVFPLSPKDKPPMLWSLSGINHHLVAEVIYDEKVHLLRLNEGDRAIGPWVIERYGANGLYLVPEVSDGKHAKKSLFLAAPTLGTSLEKFDAALPTTMQANSPNRSRAYGSDLALVQDLSDILPNQVLDAARIPGPPSTAGPANTSAQPAPR